MTGEQLFLRFAAPCAGLRLLQQKITDTQCKKIVRTALSNEQPKVTFLEECFPIAIQAFYAFMRKKSLAPWEYNSVLRYWQQHKGPSPVTLSTVVRIDSDGIRVTNGSEEEVVLNPYGLILEVNDRAYVHNSWIVVIDETSS